MTSVIPAQFSRLFFQPLLPYTSLELSCQQHLHSLLCGNLGEVSMSYNHIVEGTVTENEDFSSFLMVSLTSSIPISLPLWKKPGHLQATVSLLSLLQSSEPSQRKQRTYLLMEDHVTNMPVKNLPCFYWSVLSASWHRRADKGCLRYWKATRAKNISLGRLSWRPL